MADTEQTAVADVTALTEKLAASTLTPEAEKPEGSPKGPSEETKTEETTMSGDAVPDEPKSTETSTPTLGMAEKVYFLLHSSPSQ